MFCRNKLYPAVRARAILSADKQAFYWLNPNAAKGQLRFTMNGVNVGLLLQ